jgi:adenine-specific DNA methylase
LKESQRLILCDCAAQTARVSRFANGWHTVTLPHYLAHVIEERFQIPFVAELALREKQIQQNYRPVIAVHKWFARRPGTLFRAILLSEFCDEDLSQAFFTSQNLSKLRVADPFMGGGIPLLEANRVGSAVLGFDINPMAWWIVREEIETLDIAAYRKAADELRRSLDDAIGRFYRTVSIIDPTQRCPVKSYFWVKTQACDACHQQFDLFPGYRLARDVRHPTHVLVCACCGDLNEVADVSKAGECKACCAQLRLSGNVARGKASCPHCGHQHRVPDIRSAPYKHRLFALEYVNANGAPRGNGRLFKKADDQDLANVAAAEKLWSETEPRFVPTDGIPRGDETDRLHRWGYKKYSDLFHPRQLLALELSARLITAIPDERIRRALATNFSDLLRYQNQLCRYDSMALKVLDIFSIHGFPVGLIHAEANFLGIVNPATHSAVGSGGWVNIIDKFEKAKSYCDAPFEIRSKTTTRVPLHGEWIGEFRNGIHPRESREVVIHCADSARANIPDQSLDAVLTDPPYFGNVQYAELMDFCYVWLRRLVGSKERAFSQETTRNAEELTGNITLQRGIEKFTDGVSQVFRRMAKALKPGAPLAFTFHHNALVAYESIAVAILDARLTCSATLPSPAEMGGSIHISGTGSSIIDSVFVCRSAGKTRRSSLAADPWSLSALVERDLQQLEAGGVTPTRGDCQCIAAGHLARLAVWHLRLAWDSTLVIKDRLGVVRRWMNAFGGIEPVLTNFQKRQKASGRIVTTRVKEEPQAPFDDAEFVSF